MDSIFVPLILTEDSHRGEKMMENLHKLASVLQISAGNERVRLHSQILNLSFTSLMGTVSILVSNERKRKRIEIRATFSKPSKQLFYLKLRT